MHFEAAVTHLHVVDLDRKRQSRNGNRIRTHSPASSTGTFFDDDHTAETRSLNTSWSGSSRADSACSSHSDERKSSERAERDRRHLAKELTPTAPLPQPYPAERSKHERTTSRAEMWPPALRIVKPTFEDPRPTPHPPGMLPSTVYGGRSSSANSPAASPSANVMWTPSTDSVMSRPRPKMHRRLESAAAIDDSSSAGSRNSGHSTHSTPQNGSIGFEDPWSPKSESAAFKRPAMLKSLTGMATSSSNVRDNTVRPRVAPVLLRRPTDWTAVAPSNRHRPGPLVKLPTPPLSPSNSVMDVYSPGLESADIVIGRRVTVKGRDRSSSVPESAMSPKSPDFANMAIPETPSDTSRNTRIHCPNEDEFISPSTRPQKELPPHPHSQRRSASADQAGKREKIVEGVEPLPTDVHGSMRSNNTSISNLSIFRPDRRTIVTETIRELNAKSSAHYERYTKLRQSRQCLHSQILAVLQGTAPPSKVAKTPLELQIEIATVDAGIDDCMTKLSNLEKKRQRLTEELLDLTAARSPLRSPASSHGRNESLGIQEIIRSPRSPAIGGVAAMMAGFSFENKHSQKLLPKIPEKQRSSQVSLSLANVMDFLDTDDQYGY